MPRPQELASGRPEVEESPLATLQEAMAQLSTKVSNEGFMVLYQGALANALASFVGSHPWCAA